MPEIERHLPFLAELFPDDAPGAATLQHVLAQDIAARLARLPKGVEVQARTRDALDEVDDVVHDSPARRAIRWGVASNLISALWDAEAAREISPTGRTLLHLAASTPMEKVIPGMIDRLVRHGVPPDDQELVLDNTALHLAVERCVNTPVSKDCDDRYQREAMLLRVERLLEHGANPNRPNLFGNTALHQVFCQRGLHMAGHPIPWPLLDRLLRAGANPALPNRASVTAGALIEAALRHPRPATSHSSRDWWASPAVLGPAIDHKVHAVAREAVALRLGLDPVPVDDHDQIKAPRRRL